MTASMGLPDLGVITVDEVCFFVRQVGARPGLPVLVDGDTGYGEALNVMHMVRGFEEAGAAAVHIEDQLLPKKCGHLNDKRLADRARHGGQGRRRRARAAPSVIMVARTDAAASEGMDGAVARAQLYLEAGADAIFPEALAHGRDVPRVRRAHAGRAAARQHDRVRPHAVLHRRRVRGDGLPHGDLAGQLAARAPTRRRRSSMPPSAATAATQRMIDRMQTRASCTRRSTMPTTRRSTSIVATVVPHGMPQ